MYYITRHIPPGFDDPDTYMSFVAQLAGAIYLMVLAIDNLWKSGAIKESLQIGILGPLK
jgi:hypothetical protein